MNLLMLLQIVQLFKTTMTMRSIFKILSLFFCIALLASCAQEPLESPLYSGEITISAFQGDRQNETKTALVNGDVFWSVSEHISLFYGTGEDGGSEFISTNTEPSAHVEFSGYINAVTGTVEGNQPLMFWGIYPYNTINSCDGNSVTTVIPHMQTAKQDTFADNQFVSIGHAPGLAMGFYNLLSGLKMTFNNRTDITELRIRSLNAQDKLAGKVHVIMDEDGHPVIDNVIDGESEIILTCPEGQTFQKNHYYYALFRPQTFSQGIVIDFYAGNVFIGSRTFARSLNFYRNLFKRGDDIDADIVLAVTGVELNKTVLSLSIGDEETLQATVSPADAVDKTITWSSSDETVATVSSSGKVTALMAGQADIIATAGGKSATCVLTVSNVEVTSVTLNKSTLSLTKGSNETLTATVLPQNATEKTVVWSSSETSVATVDATGKVTAVGAGSATITATAGTITATCTVNVAIPVTSIRIYSRERGTEVSSFSMYPFDTDDLSVVCYPTDATDKSLYENSSNQTWTLSKTGYVLCTFGLISALEEGIGKSTVVTVRANGLSASCTISVLNPSPSPVDLGLSVNWADRNLYTQSSSETGRFYTWAKASNYESGRDVAMYATNGNWRLPTRAEFQELLDNCTAAQATVNGVTGIRFTASNGRSIFIPDVGGYLYNTFYPANQMGVYYWSGTADGATSCGYRLKWLTVDHSPSIETGGGTQYQFAVRPVSTTVNQIEVTSVSISPSYSTTVSLDGTKQLTATVSPSNATNKTVTWSSSNTSIATVSSSGLVTGVAVGTATIRAQAGTKYATCDVTVEKIPVSSVTISPTSLALKVGGSSSLTATVAPTNATYQTITWTSSNTSIATVSADGRVTAVSNGTAYITAKADGVSSSHCTVTVSDPDPALIYKRNYYHSETTNSHDSTREYTYCSYLTGFENAMIIQMQVEMSGIVSGNYYLGSWNLAYNGEGSCIYVSKTSAGSRLTISDNNNHSFTFNLSNYGIDAADLLTIEYNGIQHTVTVNGNTVSCSNLGQISLPYLLVRHFDNSEEAGLDDDYEKTFEGIPNNSKIYYIKAYNSSNTLIKSGARSSSKYANSANSNTKEYCWEWKSGSTTTREFATQGRYTSSPNAYEPYEAQ